VNIMMRTTNQRRVRSTIRSSIGAAAIAGATIVTLDRSAGAAIIFVRADQLLQTGFQNGSSWTQAYKDLNVALASATVGDQIWVKRGTYKPTTNNDRSASFIMENGVDILGGFAGTESLAVERNIPANPTILSGEIGGSSTTDNSFQVVIADGTIDALTTLDGLIIERGNANGGGPNTGSGIQATNANLHVVNCVVRFNTAVSGGAINSASSAGNPAPRIASTLIYANDAFGVDSQGDIGIIMVHCTIVDNNIGLRAFGTLTQKTIVHNSIVWGNGNGSEAAQLVLNTTNAVSFDSCIVQGWDFTNPAAGAIPTDPVFRDPDGLDDVAGTADDNYQLRGDSPAIDHANSTFWEPDTADIDSDGVTSEPVPFDLASQPRTSDDPLHVDTGAGAGVHPDCGAYEFNRPRTVFVDQDAVGGNNGTSWANAYTSLQSAIAELNDPKAGGDGEIWVAEGTYKPTAGTDQTASFSPGSGVWLFGGFVGNGPGGNELDRTLRNWRTHPTTLSGNIGTASSNDNSQHVVRYGGASITNTILDGFRITDGRATIATGAGGGISVINDASPLIRNCVIANNTTLNAVGGAGVFLGGSSAGNAQLVQCEITKNGGASAGSGAGVLVTAEGAEITNCVIAANNAATNTDAGGILFTTGTSLPSIRNCLIIMNAGGAAATSTNQIKHVGGGTVQMSCCAIENFGGSIAGMTSTGCFSASSVDVFDPGGEDNILGTPDDNYRPVLASPLVDAGDNTVLAADLADLDADGNAIETIPVDLRGAIRRVDMPTANTGIGGGIPVDVGAYELNPNDVPDPDFNNDSKVDATDLGTLLGAWGTISPNLDLTGDLSINAADLSILLGAWTG
jgi:hypothetical protein